MNIPPDGFFPFSITLLTLPPITVVVDFLVASLWIGASWVSECFLLDESTSTLGGEVVRLVIVSELCVLDLADSLYFRRLGDDAIVSSSGGVGVRLERLVPTARVIPAMST